MPNATAIKVLDSNGSGDYTTLAQVVTYLNSRLAAGSGLTENETIKVKYGATGFYGSASGGGASGNGTNDLSVGGPNGYYNTHTIRLTTHEDDLTTPATLGGLWTSASNDGNPGTLKFDHIKLRMSGVGSTGAVYISSGSDTVVMENYVLYCKSTSSVPRIIRASTATVVPVLRNGHNFITSSNNPITQIDVSIASGTPRAKAHNCLFCVYSSSTVTFSFENAANTNYNNTFFNYGVGVAATGGAATMVDSIVNTNPNLGAQVIQDAAEEPDVMAARNEKITMTSTAILNNAYAAEALADDINGVSRPQYTIADRGAYEYDGPILCWNYRARCKNSNRMYYTHGAGNFPRELRVPSNVDISTGCMMDKGQLINPDQFKIRS